MRNSEIRRQHKEKSSTVKKIFLFLFIIVFITFSLVCISFNVIDYIYAKRSKNKDGDDHE